MLNQSYRLNLKIELLPGFKPVKLLIPFYWTIILLLVLTACNPVPETIKPIINATAEFQEGLIGTIPITGTASEMQTSSPTYTPVVTLTPTSKSTLPPPIQATQTPMFATEVQDITGQIFVYDPFGIQQINLSDNSQEYLLVKEPHWTVWGVRFAQNQKYAAYWRKSGDATELWFTPLDQWQPKRILTVDNEKYDFATPLWGVNDRYLLFNLSILDNSSLLEEIKTIRTYIFDTTTMAFVGQPYWPGDCSILAPSPQTAQLALWCKGIESQAKPPKFLVLEPNASPWLTSETPVGLVNNCLIMAVCGWSMDGALVAYVIQEGGSDSLLYTSVNDITPISFDDKQTNYYSFPVWSPNNQFLYYSGICADGTSQCPNIISIGNQEVIWRARDNYNKGEFGIISVDHVIWSPNSRYLAIPILVETRFGMEKQILFFDVVTQQEALRISRTDSTILDLVWIAN